MACLSEHAEVKKGTIPEGEGINIVMENIFFDTNRLKHFGKNSIIGKTVRIREGVNRARVAIRNTRFHVHEWACRNIGHSHSRIRKIRRMRTN